MAIKHAHIGKGLPLISFLYDLQSQANQMKLNSCSMHTRA